MISYYDDLKKLNLDTRCYNAIQKYFFSKKPVTIKDACSLTTEQVFKLRNVGEKGLGYILNIFHEHGFYFADEVKGDDLVSRDQQMDELLVRKEKIQEKIKVLKLEILQMEEFDRELDSAINELKQKSMK